MGLPGIYVYYQYFRLPGEARERCRKGFMCHIRAYSWDEGVVLRHESTLPAAVNDRAELLAALRLQTSATHGLYRDEGFTLEALMDAAIQDPLCQTEEDYQGARDVLAVVQDASRHPAVSASAGGPGSDSGRWPPPLRSLRGLPPGPAAGRRPRRQLRPRALELPPDVPD